MPSQSTHSHAAGPSTTSDEPVDVLEVIPYMHPNAGGPPVVVDRFSRHLPALGWKTRVITTDLCARDADPRWVDESGAPYEMEVFPTSRPGAFGYSPTLAQNIDRIVRQSRLVHLHSVWTHTNLATMRACVRQKVPFVVMPHGMLDPNSLSRKWLKKQIYGRLVEFPLLRKASGMLYTNRVEQEVTQQAVSGLPPGYVVTLGTDDPPTPDRPVLAAEFLADYPHLRGKEIVLFLSRLHPKKGLDLLIPAFARYAASRPHAHLVIVGAPDGDYQTFLDGLVRQTGTGERVTFTGPKTGRQKWAAFAAARLFVLSSYQEAFPLATIEAMRMGLPIILSNKVNIWEDIVQAGAGFECELTVDGVTRALIDLGDKPLVIQQAGAAAERLVLERFTWTKSTELLCQAFDKVLAARQAPAAAATG